MNRVLVVLLMGGLFIATSTVPGSSSLTGVVGAAPVLAIVSGTVKSDNGTPLSGATVALFEASLNGKLIKSLKTDDSGKFAASIAPGAYNLRAEAAGHKARFTRINLDRAQNLTFNFALKRSDTLVEKRGDRDDWRWIGRSVPRSVMHYDETEIAENTSTTSVASEPVYKKGLSSIHGVAQFVSSSSPEGTGFLGANFAVAGSLNSNVEMALIGQSGVGENSMQRLALITTMRPTNNHQVTAALGYGRMPFVNRSNRHRSQLEQGSLSVMDAWQVSQPLLIVYGFDYSRFTGRAGKQGQSILPRLAVQYSPAANTALNAAVTSGKNFVQNPDEGLKTEDINAAQMPEAAFQTQPAEVAFNGDSPLMDRSRRYEFGVAQTFNEGAASLEVSAFYDVISNRGVGVLALPLEATPETQAAFHQVAHHVTAMNGSSRGMRVMYSRRLNEYVTASAGYSFGRGQQFNQGFNPASSKRLSPAEMFEGGFFQVASAKLSFDLSRQTGTTISTVIRLSPSAVVFAIDPFAGRMSVFDPNVSVYVTQELPTFGLPVRCQAIVDVRNLLNETIGVEDGVTRLIASRSQRTVRGGLAFRW